MGSFSTIISQGILVRQYLQLCTEEFIVSANEVEYLQIDLNNFFSYICFSTQNALSKVS